MKGVKVVQHGSPYEVVDDLPTPSPGPGQLLVKVIWTAVNPVDTYIKSFSPGLVADWPWIPGCDLSGIVTEIGSNVTGFAVGDEVCGIPGLGFNGVGGAAEYSLFNANIAFKKPSNFSLPEASTFGVGLMTAANGLYDGLDVPLPDIDNPATEKDEWILVLGGGGNVGRYVSQLAKIGGYKVIVTASKRSTEAAKIAGADVVVDYSHPVEQQVSEIISATSKKLYKIYDSTSSNTPFAKAVFEALGATPETHRYATVNDWEPHDVPAKVFMTTLGITGRADAVELNASLSAVARALQPYLDAGKFIPGEYVIAGGEDAVGVDLWEKAVDIFLAKETRKVVLKVQ